MTSPSSTEGPAERRIETPNLLISAPASLLAELGERVTEGRSKPSQETLEIGGALFGRREGDALRITAYRPVACEHSEGSAYRLSARDEEGLRRVLESAVEDVELKDLEPVGWYRSEHRDMFFSDADQALYNKFFPNPWQVALIFRWAKTEPVQIGVFTRDLNERAKFRCSVSNEMPAPAEPETRALPETVVEEPAAAPVPTYAGAPVWARLGLQQDPFPPRLDTSFVRVSTQHREAVAELYYGVQKRNGLMLLTGERGVGRRQVLESLGDLLNQQHIEFAFLLDAPMTLEHFYEMVGYDMALPCATSSKVEVLSKLTELAVQQSAAESTVVVILDEVDPLPVEVLEEICLLDNMQNRHGKLLQVILSGTPDLEARLTSPDVAGLNLLIGHRRRLHRMDEMEVVEYVEGRLQRAGVAKDGLIPEAQLAVIAAQSRGLPLEVHRLCTEFLDALTQQVAGLESPLRLQNVLEELRKRAAAE